MAETTVGRHSNGDQPTGTLFIAPSDPRFRRAAGNRKGKSSGRATDTVVTSGSFQAPKSSSGPETSVIPVTGARTVRGAQPAQARAALPAGSAASTALIPAQRPGLAPPPSAAVVPVARAASPVRSGLPPAVRMAGSAVLPLWTKVCVVLGAVLVLLGFGGLGAAYAMSKSDSPPSSSTDHTPSGTTPVKP